MLNLACRNTGKLVRAKSKSDNVRLGRLFTKKDTAKVMADMFSLDRERKVYTVLDPGAGTGILSAALIEKICRECPACKQIILTAYENDPVFLPVLEDNLERIRKKCRHDYDVRLYTTVLPENYILCAKEHYTVTNFQASENTYDLIICHPPMELYEKDSEEAKSAQGVTQVKIRLCYLFLKTGLRHLEAGGQFVCVLPTEFATAGSLSALRAEVKEAVKLRSVHLFVGKVKNRDRAVPVKKDFIAAYQKTDELAPVDVSLTAEDGSFEKLSPLPYGFVVDEKDGTLTLPKSEEDTKIVNFMQSMPETLSSLGFKMSTGLVLDSRCQDMIFNDENDGVIPLIRPFCIKDGYVRFPGLQKSGDAPFPVMQKGQYLAPHTPSLLQKNRNLLMIKRVPAKSDGRFVNAGIYLASSLPKHAFISTHNKLTFIEPKDKRADMSARAVFGLYALLNSTVYDRYIAIVSKSKQINAKEFRDLPLPELNLIESMGMRLLDMRKTTVEACDAIVNQTLHITARN